MEEEFGLVWSFAIIMAVAGAVTLLFRWLHQPPILGYLIAGLIIGPYTIPFLFDGVDAPVTDVDTIVLLADLGLIVLLFGIGLEFSWSKIREVGLAVIVIGAIEIITMMSLGYGVGRALGWSPMESVFLGAALHISSSAIIFKILSDSGRLGALSSRLIIGILVVEDFAAVTIIAILSGIGGIDTANAVEPIDIGYLVLRLIAFVVVTLVIGKIVVPRILSFTHRFKSKEACLISGLGMCFVMALIGDLLELSAVIGAFLIGTIIADSKHSDHTKEVTVPVRDMFAAVFFVTIGMLINIADFREFIIPGIVVAAVFILGKIIADTVATYIAGYDGKTALNVGMGMPQMGEFSLAISKVGIDRGLVTAPLYPVIALSTAITAFTTPYFVRSADRVADLVDRKLPRLLRIYLSYLTDWLQAIRGTFSRDSESARMVQHSMRVIIVNILILIVFMTAGALTLRFVDDLAEASDIPIDIVGLLVGFVVIVLCFPSLVVIWRNIRVLVDEATTYAISRRRTAKRWQREPLRHVLRDSIVIIVFMLLALWFVPLFVGLLSIGSYALVVPLFWLALVVFLVFTHMRHIHGEIEHTFSSTLLGEEYISTSEAADLLGVSESAVSKMAREKKLLAVKRGRRWRIVKSQVEQLAKTYPSSPLYAAEEGYSIEYESTSNGDDTE